MRNVSREGLRPRTLRTETGKRNCIGERVAERRGNLHLKQVELGAMITENTGGVWEVAPKEISRLENGHTLCTDLQVIVLSQVLECSPLWLLTGEGPVVFPTNLLETLIAMSSKEH